MAFYEVVLLVALISSVSSVGVSRNGPSHLPSLRVPIGVLSSYDGAQDERTVTYRKDAGLSPHLTEPEILSLGGREAEPGEFPFVVTLQVRTWSFTHACGGSILTHHTVLTAAHCVKDSRADRLIVIAGKLHLRNQEESEQTRKVTRFVIHKDYDPNDVSPNDVALLFVEEAFQFNQFVQSIPLANPLAKESEGVAVVAGWGNTATWPYESYPSVMQTEILPLMSHAECVAQLKTEYFNLEVTESMLCTGPLKKNFGPCHGDSGGPLVQERMLIGIVSWISGRCGYSSVSGFTRVSSFTEWILEVDSRVRHHNSTTNYDELGVYRD